MRTMIILSILVLGWAPALAQDSAAKTAENMAAQLQSVIFAGGCFWCVESDFDHVPGVVSTTSGYSGGHLDKPTYKDVVSETSGHREVVRIEFDPAKVSYEKLLDVFWHSVDPTDADGQFCDRGESYTTAIYATTDMQIKLAEQSKVKIEEELGQPVATLIAPAATFWPAETYHQDYYIKNPIRYQFYRTGCRRDARLSKLWGKESHRGIEK